MRIFIQMIRTILFAAILLSAVTVKAQMPLSFGALNGTQPYFSHFNQVGGLNTLHKKWFFSKYAGISTGIMAFNGGMGTFLSAPMGLQINRQLNNNTYAFAGVSVAPSFYNFNGAFSQPMLNKNNGFMNANHFGAWSTGYMGLMYINNDRTFSISGSIGVSRYNGYSPFYAPATSPVLRQSNHYYR
jgi:hypothetical protein